MTTFGLPEALFILRAAGWTLVLTSVAFILGGLIGGVFAIMRLSQVAALRRFAAGYILVIQSIPVLMVLFMSYYGLSAMGVELPPFLAAESIREKRLLPLLPQHPLPEQQINLIYPRHRHPSSIVRAYLEFCQSYLPQIRQACAITVSA